MVINGEVEGDNVNIEFLIIVSQYKFPTLWVSDQVIRAFDCCLEHQ